MMRFPFSTLSPPPPPPPEQVDPLVDESEIQVPPAVQKILEPQLVFDTSSVIKFELLVNS